jgi:hypothetical protein
MNRKAKKIYIFNAYFWILTDESLQISNSIAFSGSNISFIQLDPLSDG